jgi:hypothetical protein
MNGNPFYVPPVIPDMGDTILGIGKLGMEKQLAETKMADERDYRTQMLNQGAEQNDIRRQEVALKTPASQKPWDMSNVTKMKNQLRLKGLDPDKMPDVFEPLETMAKDTTMNRGDIATAMEQGWNTEFKPRIINNLGKQSEVLAKKAAGMKEDDPERSKVLTEMKKLEDYQSTFAQINSEHVVPGFFSDIDEERRNSRVAIAAARGDQYAGTNGVIYHRGTGDIKYAKPNEKLIPYTDENGEERLGTVSDARGQKAVKKAGKKSLADLLGQGGAGGNLRPITPDVIATIKKTAKTREEAEAMARKMGFDPTVTAQ